MRLTRKPEEQLHSDNFVFVYHGNEKIALVFISGCHVDGIGGSHPYFTTKLSGLMKGACICSKQSKILRLK